MDRDRDPDPPRGWRRFARFFVGVGLVAPLGLVPYLGSIVAALAVLYLTAETLLFARIRVAGVITTSLLSLVAEASDARVRDRLVDDDLE